MSQFNNQHFNKNTSNLFQEHPLGIEPIIEEALLKVDSERNIFKFLDLAVNGQIELATQRFNNLQGGDQFEVRDKEFILILNLLFELTFHDTIINNHRKADIEKLLNYLGSRKFTGGRIYFFPGNLVFLLVCELAKSGVDYSNLFRTKHFIENIDWIEEMGPYNDLQFRVLIEFANGVENEEWKCRELIRVYAELDKQGEIEAAELIMHEALECARWQDAHVKSLALISISSQMAALDKQNISASIMQETIDYLRSIISEFSEDHRLVEISKILTREGKLDEALEFARQTDAYTKASALIEISRELATQGKEEQSDAVLHEAYECASLEEDWCLLSIISEEFLCQGNHHDSDLSLRAAIHYAIRIEDRQEKDSSLEELIKIIIKQGKLELAFECAEVINDWEIRQATTRSIKKGAIVDKIEDINNLITNRWTYSDSIKTIKKLADSDRIGEALEIARKMDFDGSRNYAYSIISIQLVNRRKIQESRFLMLVAIDSYQSFNRKSVLHEISKELAQDRRFDDAIFCADNEISSLSEISIELAKLGRFNEAYECSQGDLNTLIKICKEMAFQSKLEEAVVCLDNIESEEARNCAKIFICSELVKRNRSEEANTIIQETISSVRKVSDWVDDKLLLLNDICVELAFHGKTMEAMEFASYSYRVGAILSTISTALFVKGRYEESNLLMNEAIINAKSNRFYLPHISGELATQGKIEEANLLLQDAFEMANTIGYNKFSCCELENISIEFAKHENWHNCEKLGIEINSRSKSDCWMKIAIFTINNKGWQYALNVSEQFQNSDVRCEYLRGWAEGIKISQVDNDCLMQALPLLMNYSKSTYLLLNKYAFNRVFFVNSSKELLNRLNRFINIQWAMDIGDKMPSRK